MKKLTLAIVIITFNMINLYGEGLGIIDKAKKELDSLKVNLADSFMYVGGGVSFMSLTNETTLEKFSGMSKNLIAGFQYGDYLAIEGRYVSSFGSVTYDAGTSVKGDNSNYPTDFTNMAIYLKAITPFGDAGLYGLIGYGQVGLTNIPDGNVDRTVTSLQYGAGGSYKMFNNIIIFADYIVAYNAKGFNGLGTDNNHYVSYATVGFLYQF